MHGVAIIAALILSLANTSLAQEKPRSEQAAILKKCRAKLTRQAPELKELPIRIHEGERSTGFSPVIALEILESGEVAHARVKRSSGFVEVDAQALNRICRTK